MQSPTNSLFSGKNTDLALSFNQTIHIDTVPEHINSKFSERAEEFSPLPTEAATRHSSRVKFLDRSTFVISFAEQTSGGTAVKFIPITNKPKIRQDR